MYFQYINEVIYLKSCFLFGHSDCPDTMLPKIEKTIENHYLNFNVRYFMLEIVEDLTA